MAKLVWQVSKDENRLWATVICNKYFKIFFGNVNKKCLGSRTWSGIKKGWPLFSKGSYWDISNGLTTSAWHDKWVGGVTIRRLLIGPLSPNEDGLMVSDILLGNGIVDLSRISFVLPSQLTDSLKAIPIQFWSNNQDTDIGWTPSTVSLTLNLLTSWNLVVVVNSLTLKGASSFGRFLVYQK